METVGLSLSMLNYVRINTKTDFSVGLGGKSVIFLPKKDHS